MTRPARLDRVLCATDFSSFSTAALDRAVALAAAYGATVRLLHVLTPFPIAAPFLDVPGDPQLYETAAAQGRRSLAAEAARVQRPGLTIEIAQRDGHAVQEIVTAAAEWPADLIAIGTHGHGGFERLVLGSVAEKVLRKAPCPVLAVPQTGADGDRAERGLSHVLCAHDGSEASRAGVAYAQALAERSGARLTLVSVVESLPYGGDFVAPEFAAFRAARDQHARHALDTALSAADRVRLDVHERIVYGHPGQQIVEVAAQERPDLVVMGVQGRGALDLLMFGSTTHYVLRHASTPVLTVRPEPKDQQTEIREPAGVGSR
jgi:nucleotide-binding universal stress UspA family protein